MPITITPQSPANTFGPGLRITWVSDLVGPITTDSTFLVRITADAESTQLVSQTRFVSNGSKQGTWLYLISSGQTDNVLGTFALTQGQTAHVEVQLVENAVVIDSGTLSVPWDTTGGLGLQIQQKPTAGSGLTGLQAQQLQQAQEATWPEHLVDQLTLQALGTGSASSPIGANLTTPCFGVIVRITSIPAELQPQTPDGIYWVKTLASVIVFRGSDIWLRVPIHTPSKLINLWVEGLALGLADAVLSAGWLLDLSLQVFFLDGVTGDVFLMRVP